MSSLDTIPHQHSCSERRSWAVVIPVKFFPLLRQWYRILVCKVRARQEQWWRKWVTTRILLSHYRQQPTAVLELLLLSRISSCNIWKMKRDGYMNGKHKFCTVAQPDNQYTLSRQSEGRFVPNDHTFGGCFIGVKVIKLQPFSHHL